MGVISVGASLGVKDDTNAHPIISTSSNVPSARRRGAVARSPSSSSVSPSALSARAHYSASSSLYHQQYASSSSNNNNEYQSSQTFSASRKKPLRRRTTTTTVTTNGMDSLASSNGGVTTGGTDIAQPAASNVSRDEQQDEMGQWQVTRVVAVPTSCDPQLLLPHVIGNRGARINAIMSQAKCIIVHRKRDARSHSDASGSSTAGFAMSFQVSADSIKRVKAAAGGVFVLGCALKKEVTVCCVCVWNAVVRVFFGIFDDAYVGRPRSEAAAICNRERRAADAQANKQRQQQHDQHNPRRQQQTADNRRI